MSDLTPVVDVKTTSETGPQPQLRPFTSNAHLAPEAPPASPTRPLVPPAVAAVLATLATVGSFAAGVLAAPASGIIAGLSLVLALLAGMVGFKVPAFAAGRPLVRATLIPAFTGACGLLVTAAEAVPEGAVRGFVMLGAVACAVAAGIPLPQPRR